MENAIEDNKSLLRKADLVLSDLVSNGGYLQPAQAQKFVRVMIKGSKLLPLTTVVPMKSHNQFIDKINFSSRVLRAGQEGVALASSDRSKPTLGKVELAAKLFKAEVRLDNETLEDNIERGELRNTIMQLVSEAIGRDCEEAVISGDTSSTDPFLAQFDGLLVQATTNAVNAAGAQMSKTLCRDLLKALPQEYRRNKSALRFFTSGNAELDYRDSLSDRTTPAGDKYVETNADVAYQGIPVLDLPIMPENIGTSNNKTCTLLLDPKNINVGIWRQIRIETDKNVSEGTLIIVASVRFDAKYAVEPAVAIANNVGLSL